MKMEKTQKEEKEGPARRRPASDYKEKEKQAQPHSSMDEMDAKKDGEGNGPLLRLAEAKDTTTVVVPQVSPDEEDVSSPMIISEDVGVATVVADPDGTQLEAEIVAVLATDNADARIAQRAEELLRRQMEEGEVIVAAELKDDSSFICGWKKRTLLLLGILTVLLIVGGVVGGVLSTKTAAEIQLVCQRQLRRRHRPRWMMLSWMN
jgi:hypothetical protein